PCKECKVTRCCTKIGVVKFSKVDDEFFPAQEAQKRFDVLIQQINEEHEKMLQEGKKFFEERDKILKDPALSNAAKKKMEDSIMEKIKKQGEAIGRFRQEKEEKVHTERQEVLSKNYKELAGVIERIGKEGGFDLILNETYVLYAKPELDITEKVIQRANQPYQTQIKKQSDLAKKEAEKGKNKLN
ncbi:MAG: OmpH family outer membrane protein, partial [Opitutales bacterium]|nr:OmpH family outer membrane protein [Opitutales bacterium]